MEPSVITTMPIVEWSVITFLVPISAASSKGISLSYQGVVTILGISSSICPSAPLTKYPTQSTILTLKFILSFKVISTASLGTNLRSVVIIVLPEPLKGNSSLALSFLYLFSILGNTSNSINLLMKVDFPVLTGPTTPAYMSPSVLSAISLYISNPSIFSLLTTIFIPI